MLPSGRLNVLAKRPIRAHGAETAANWPLWALLVMNVCCPKLRGATFPLSVHPVKPLVSKPPFVTGSVEHSP